MKTEIYKKLKEFDAKFISASNTGFVRFSAPEVERFSSILAEYRGTPLSRQERSCPRCFFKTLKEVGNDYFKFKNSPRGKKVDIEDSTGGDMEAD